MAYDQRVLGYGSLVRVDPAGGSSYTTLTGCTSITPPDKEWNKVDGSTLDDVFEVTRGGTQKATELVFSQVWIVFSTNHIIPDTLFAAKTIATWVVSYPQGTVVTDTFSGWVSKITAAVKGPNEYWTREITVTATTAITRA